MVLSLVAVFCMTWVINRGHQAVFSFLKTSSYAMVGLLLISGIGNLLLMVNNPQLIAQNMQQSLSAPSFFKGTSDSFLSQLPFFIFAITAFGGLDTIASLVDKSGQQRKKFPKALIISAVVIVVLYFGGIMLWSGANNLNVLRETDQFHLGNLMYGLMGSLANNISISFGLSASAQTFLYQAFIRYTAFTLFVAYIGLLSSITYTPLKSLIQGTPKEIWPQFLTKINQKQMPQTALWIQASVVSVCIIGLSLNSTILGALFNQLTYMTNVARAIPYFVVAASYPFYRIKNPGLLKHSLIASHWQGYLCSLSVCTATLIAITFQVYQPFHTGEYVQALLLIIGPILFGLLGSSIYQRFEKKRTQLFLEDNL
jgi:amino acid transporter